MKDRIRGGGVSHISNKRFKSVKEASPADFLTDKIMDKYNEALERAKKWEREHPHGYVIKDMMEYIFPGLRESEDERIRKHLVEIVEIYWGNTNDPDKAKDLAYLEKQKEPKPVETYDFKTKLAEYLQNNSPKDGQYVISSESILEMAKEELLKRGELKEQKPSIFPVGIGEVHWNPISPEQVKQRQLEWKLPDDFEEAVYKVANFISPFDSQEELRKTSHCFAEQLLSLAKKELVQKPVEWSEEDEKMLKRIEAILLTAEDDLSDKLNGKVSPITDSAYSSMKLCIAKCLSWLKSLPLNLKKKNEDVAKLCSNEWSEEDSKRYISIGTTLETSVVLSKEDYDANMAWLRELVNAKKYSGPQPHWKPSEVCYGAKGDPDPAGVWKPSEEQMDALSMAVNKLAKSDVADSVRLSIMYDNLKKLM